MQVRFSLYYAACVLSITLSVLMVLDIIYFTLFHQRNFNENLSSQLVFTIMQVIYITSNLWGIKLVRRLKKNQPASKKLTIVTIVVYLIF